MALSEAKSLVDAANENDILKIISNLPSGWKVVGLTELNQDKGSSFMPRLLCQDAETKGNELQKNSKQVDNEVNSTNPLKISNIQDPLVSYGKSNSSMRDSSVNFPSLNHMSTPILPFVKTECHDEGNIRSCKDKNINQCDGTFSNTNNFKVTVGADHPPIKLDNEVNSYAPQELASQISKTAEQGCNKQVVPHAQSVLSPFGIDSKWTVVGITSLQQLQGTEINTTNFGSPFSNSSTLVPSGGKKSTGNSVHQSQTILKIPHCGFQNSGQTVPFNSDITAPRASGMNTFEADSEVMRWTVVGITTSISSTTTPFFMAPQSSSLATTVSPSLVNASKISSKNTEETLPVTSPLLLSSIHSAQPSLLSKTTDNTNQSNCLLSAFPGISSLVNSDIQSQVPSEWRVVGISPIVSAPNALSNLTQLKPDQLLQLPTNSLASESDLITTSATVSTTTIYTSTVQSQIPTLGSSSGSEVINTYTQVTQPMPMRPSAWQDPAKRLARSPNILPLTVPITSPGSNEKPYVGDPLHVLNHDHHILSCATSSKLQDGLKDVDFVPLKEAQNSNWKVVGVVANNQVSMLSSDQRCEDNDFDRDSRYLEPFTMTALSNPSIPLPVLPSEGKDPIRVQKLQSDRNFQYVSMENRREDHENSSTLQMTPKDHESCPYKRKQFDWNRRAKDMLKKPSSKLKKNTVSNLLKMRRCQSSGPEHPDIHSGQEFHEENHLRFTDDSPRKRCRSRSLRSYSGNRHEFQGSPDGRDSAFHLRSSSDTTVSDHNSEDETERNQLVKMEKLSPPVSPVTSSDKHTEETSSHSFSKSPARRRKLKVPRKMVADLDYHPFDSSSDSN